MPNTVVPTNQITYNTFVFQQNFSFSNEPRVYLSRLLNFLLISLTSATDNNNAILYGFSSKPKSVESGSVLEFSIESGKAITDSTFLTLNSEENIIIDTSTDTSKNEVIVALSFSYSDQNIKNQFNIESFLIDTSTGGTFSPDNTWDSTKEYLILSYNVITRDSNDNLTEIVTYTNDYYANLMTHVHSKNEQLTDQVSSPFQNKFNKDSVTLEGTDYVLYPSTYNMELTSDLKYYLLQNLRFMHLIDGMDYYHNEDNFIFNITNWME